MKVRTLVLLVEATVAAATAERVALCVPLTTREQMMLGSATNEGDLVHTRRRWYLCTIKTQHCKHLAHRALLHANYGPLVWEIRCALVPYTEVNEIRTVGRSPARVTGTSVRPPTHPPLKPRQIAPFKRPIDHPAAYDPPTVKNSAVLTMVS